MNRSPWSPSVARLRRSRPRRSVSSLLSRWADQRARQHVRNGGPQRTRPLLAINGVEIHKSLVVSPFAHDREHTPLAGGAWRVDGQQLEGVGALLRNNGEQVPASHAVDLTDACDLDRLPIVERPIFFAGPVFHHYGHFLAESLGRLWAYSDFRHLDPAIVWLPAARTPNGGSHPYIFETLRGFGIPADRVWFPDAPFRCRSAIVPDQLYGFDSLGHVDDRFIDFLKTFRPGRSAIGRKRRARLYVSRSRFGSTGRIIGEQVLEAHLRDEGYHVFHPQDFSLTDQVEMYRQAEQIVFAEGSSTLTCVLLPDLTADVAIIARRRNPEGVEFSGRELIDPFSGFDNPPHWIDHVTRQFPAGAPFWHAIAELDLRAVSRELATLGFAEHEIAPELLDDWDQRVQQEVGSYLRSFADHPDIAPALVALSDDLTGDSH